MHVRGPQDSLIGCVIVAVAAFDCWPENAVRAGTLGRIGPGMLPQVLAILLGGLGVLLGVGLAGMALGTDPGNAWERVTLGITDPCGGVDLAVLAMAIFGITEILRNLGKVEACAIVRQRIGRLLPSLRGTLLCSRPCVVLALPLLALSLASANAQTAGITELGALPGYPISRASSVSGDGRVVVGYGSTETGGANAFRWTSSGGLASLGFLSGINSSIASGVNRDGTAVVGSAAVAVRYEMSHGTLRASGYDWHAFRWTSTTGMVSLGVFDGGRSSHAVAVNADGSVIVGNADIGPGAPRAFRWTAATRMVNLGLLNGGSSSGATAVNADGTVVVGTASLAMAADGSARNRAFRWTQGTGMVSLGTLTGGGNSSASGVSANGSVVVGSAYDEAAGFRQRAFRWTQESGMVSLGTLPGGTDSTARAVNADGSVVVGDGASIGGPGPILSRAFRWTRDTGMQTVEAWLRANGVSVPADITYIATSVSDDGSVVVGHLESGPSGPAFIARVSSAGNGLIPMPDLQSSLLGNASAAAQATALGGLVLNGAHGRPLAHRIEPARTCFWTAGDAGRDDHGDRDGSFALAEVGGCRRLAQDVQGSFSVGTAASRQHLVFNGRSDVDTTYGVAEVLGRIAGTNLWPSAAIHYQRGEADVRRGYLNAGVQDYSSGRPDVRTAALRLRLDWDNAARFGGADLTPYVDVIRARSRIAAYTESGGGFPARFDSRTERATELHIGADAAYTLGFGKLLGRLEGAHRVEKSGPSTTGTVLGLSTFDIPGQRNRRDWLRASLGLETKLGNGVGSVILNGTTQGAVPSYWLNVSYRLKF